MKVNLRCSTDFGMLPPEAEGGVPQDWNAGLTWHNGSRPSQALALTLSLLILGNARALETNGDWPQFLGPSAKGISSERGLLDSWPAKGPPQVWEKAIGTGYGAPSIRSNRLVFHDRVDEQEIVN